ncbi:mannosyl-oligosaccharide glucosidase GCS1 isoform X2 [Harpegnathos saltator]|uniref:Mannosyl-oligosaccharide glucosidase n=2 Tax=Harpegnathos saltator TaxID=610380 RepID=E2C3D1_HARSA|nr:mannosyl-oligosaccharide glucosidase GCS1 isoform X2 [Harpegnathos saltator]XP_011149947.1 mannosyl-oligosaccharide glucosidase GCS1 isoform X2 [Harpegnathos saltator]XP_011149948.1 mannosyl-oligosaccharide glucosidase GCS1 isoform X2 [Harpegnathos saltator]XP_011149950.1 mannosyl-oligosaccharide glucosidase GCS1 isoform X2 [Harpegnathos saltator]XP_011149951.1 mannosyl-oligosaccharide glucosidase GCS1 isoform X2 [Harpegnathos saltator]XP_025153083.1 mannosyl-oligosaccharide glucosidase GCS
MAKNKPHETKITKSRAKHTGSPRSNKSMLSTNAVITALCIVVASWFGYKGYIETRVNTPFDIKKLVTASGLAHPDRYWGTYRPGVYFGLKTRDPHSLVTGLMWYFPRFLHPDGSGLRHWCEQGDGLERYAWLEHDGRTFGVQEIADHSTLIKTTFVKRLGGHHGGDWTARIAVSSEKREGEEMSLLFYTAIEEGTKGWIKANLGDDHHLTGMEGNTQGLGSFVINLNLIRGTVEEHSFLVTTVSGLSVLKENIIYNLRLVSQKGSAKKHVVLAGEQLPLSNDGKKTSPNFIATQITGKIPFEIEVSYESGSFGTRVHKLTGDHYDAALEKQRQLFSDKFESVFRLKSKGYTDDEVAFAKMAFSNLLGSVGYFYGAAQVQSVHNKTPVPYWKAPLYTAVPSRSFFPRGFLWDEGFHGLLVSAWDTEIELDIVCHWLDLMNVEGWIPREMILGQEALAKVPEEFVTQINTNANPPVFFLTLDFMLRHREHELSEKHLQILDRLYPRLEAWFAWFNTTQVGDLPGTYRWRGRDATAARELNPKTLTSGLDDYPRASHPNDDERHVDLRCWIAFAARVMARIAETLNYPSNKYQETHQYLSDNELLNKLHWSSDMRAYCDYGLHTDKVALRKPPASPSAQKQRPHTQPSEMVRVVLENPVLRFVDTTFGYVSLFPFILQIVEPDSPQLIMILRNLKDPDLLWTKYGLRSLAKTSPLYMKYNTEYDPPYWRGPVWINLNYLTARAAYYYSNVEGPYREDARKVYNELRQNLIQNIMKQYRETGYLWENYDNDRGAGKGSHPFTGWTSLVVLLMAEMY